MMRLDSAFPDTGPVEYLTGLRFIDDLVVGGWHLDAEGMLPVPDRPGLGVSLNPEAPAKYTRGEKLLE